MLDKIKQFFQTKTGAHIYSFTKTYVTMFIGTYLVLHNVADQLDPEAVSKINLTDIGIISTAAKSSFLAVLRNIYKLLTEK